MKDTENQFTSCQLLTPQEVMRTLKISRDTLHRYIHNNTLPVIRLSPRKLLFKAEDIARIATPDNYKE